MEVRTATFAELDTTTLYAILRLRVDVFVVEQACAYPELDGHDTHDDALHCWIADGGEVVAVARLLSDPDGVARIGRIATRRDVRGRGLAGRVIRHALSIVEGPVRMSAQAHLVGYYAGFGFSVAGEEFLDDGIPHVPMRLDR